MNAFWSLDGSRLAAVICILAVTLRLPLTAPTPPKQKSGARETIAKASPGDVMQVERKPTIRQTKRRAT